MWIKHISGKHIFLFNFYNNASLLEDTNRTFNIWSDAFQQTLFLWCGYECLFVSVYMYLSVPSIRGSLTLCCTKYWLLTRYLKWSMPSRSRCTHINNTKVFGLLNLKSWDAIFSLPLLNINSSNTNLMCNPMPFSESSSFCHVLVSDGQHKSPKLKTSTA